MVRNWDGEDQEPPATHVFLIPNDSTVAVTQEHAPHSMVISFTVNPKPLIRNGRDWKSSDRTFSGRTLPVQTDWNVWLKPWHFALLPPEGRQPASCTGAGALAAEGCRSGAAPSGAAFQGNPLPTLAQESSVLTGPMLWGSLGDDLIPHWSFIAFCR